MGASIASHGGRITTSEYPVGEAFRSILAIYPEYGHYDAEELPWQSTTGWYAYCALSNELGASIVLDISRRTGISPTAIYRISDMPN